MNWFISPSSAYTYACILTYDGFLLLICSKEPKEEVSDSPPTCVLGEIPHASGVEDTRAGECKSHASNVPECVTVQKKDNSDVGSCPPVSGKLQKASKDTNRGGKQSKAQVCIYIRMCCHLSVIVPFSHWPSSTYKKALLIQHSMGFEKKCQLRRLSDYRVTLSIL